ncbi:DsbA family oxidoreductase [Actinocrispum wychmicini]|uniref:Putative DsbA family dithiol-disulfide isomerase n=1 Tax=Actinocrispum wychmicini TaxID=1213861 RepID=A0A4R2J1S1_9PSEU|nr:DsbA family protein [Actinocrispum wychmicini]TCO50698.1 putative DsbA family dithiol-disulfide isomerase [Actinocrispum wychmicini]
MITVTPGTIQVWSDLLCPFAHVAIHRLTAARDRLGLDVRLDHHTFALELFNGPHPRPGTDSEAVGLGQIAPEAGFRLWSAADWLYPSTVLLAAEAVHAAKAQGLGPAEDLDRALRKAFWLESKSIGHRQVILDVAAETSTVDVIALATALDEGKYRSHVMADHKVAQTDDVTGSPHLFLPDGSSVHNPGIDVRWEGPWAAGYPIARDTDPGWAENLLKSVG